MTARTWIRLWIVALLASRSAAFAQATAPASRSGIEMARVELAFNHRTLDEAYDAVGTHDARWDPAAKAFLGDMAVRFTEAGSSDVLRAPGERTAAQLLAEGKAVIDSGCGDPMVRYCYAILLKDTGQPTESRDALRRLLPVMLDSRYPAFRKMNAARHFLDATVLQPNAPLRRRAAAALAAEMKDYLLSPEADPLERRLKVSMGVDLLHSKPEVQKQALSLAIGDAAEGVQLDPWLEQMLRGIDEVGQAWAARGGGYADSVTPQGWAGFADHLAKAREHLLAANEKEPNYPEAAAQMITVAMGAGGVLQESPDKWFERAIAAEVDYMPAWSAMAWQLRPRWGGSYDKMYRLGRRAMQTGRYDTPVPAYLLTILNDIAHDQDVDYRYFTMPAVWDDVRQVFDGYLKQPGADVRQLKSLEAAYAYRCDQFDEMAKLVGELDGKPEADAFARLDADVDEATAVAAAFASDVGPALKSAFALERADDDAGASAAYEKILQPLPATHPAHAFLARRLNLATTLATVHHAGVAQIPLRSPDDLLVWSGESTDGWSVGEDGLQFTATGSAERAVRHALMFPRDCTIEFSWRWSTPVPTQFVTIAIEFRKLSRTDAISVALYPEHHTAKLKSKQYSFSGKAPSPQVDSTRDAWHKVRIARKGSLVSVWQDDVLLYDRIASGWFEMDDTMLGFWVQTPAGGGTATIRDLSVGPPG